MGSGLSGISGGAGGGMSAGGIGAGGVGAGGMSVGGMGGSGLGGGMAALVSGVRGPAVCPLLREGLTRRTWPPWAPSLHAFAAGGVLNYFAQCCKRPLQAQLDALEASLLSTSGGDGLGADSVTAGVSGPVAPWRRGRLRVCPAQRLGLAD